MCTLRPLHVFVCVCACASAAGNERVRYHINAQKDNESDPQRPACTSLFIMFMHPMCKGLGLEGRCTKALLRVSHVCVCVRVSDTLLLTCCMSALMSSRAHVAKPDLHPSALSVSVLPCSCEGSALCARRWCLAGITLCATLSHVTGADVVPSSLFLSFVS